MSSASPRIDLLRTTLKGSISDPVVQSIFEETLNILDGVLEEAEGPMFDRDYADSFVDDVDSALSRARDLGYDSSNAAILRWAEDSLTAIASTVANSDLLHDPTDFLERVRGLHQEIALQIDQEAFRARLEKAASDAESIAQTARDAAGVTGDLTLSKYFSELGVEQRVSANWFRGFAIALIVIAVLLAIVTHPGFAAGEWIVPKVKNEWVALTYRLALLVGIGTLATYLARQAGHHRRIADWAEALSVQLKTLEAFVAPLEPEDRADIYRVFASRVLGASPGTGSHQDESLSISQASDLLITLLRRNPQQSP